MTGCRGWRNFTKRVSESKYLCNDIFGQHLEKNVFLLHFYPQIEIFSKICREIKSFHRERDAIKSFGKGT